MCRSSSSDRGGCRPTRPIKARQRERACPPPPGRQSRPTPHTHTHTLAHTLTLTASTSHRPASGPRRSRLSKPQRRHPVATAAPHASARRSSMQVARPTVAQSFPSGSSSQPAMYANSPHGIMAAPTFNRSFSDANGYQPHSTDKPQIYTVRMPTLRPRTPTPRHVC